jgi:hypothetical protein
MLLDNRGIFYVTIFTSRLMFASAGTCLAAVDTFFWVA